MIKVTLGAETPQREKPFPKLMIGHEDWIVEVHKDPLHENRFIAIHRAGSFKGKIAYGFNTQGFTDYNEPITIQNA